MGITDEIAHKLIQILVNTGQVYITSERNSAPEFETFRLKINPIDMHHVMAFASCTLVTVKPWLPKPGYLGIPFVRLNDFVGRLGYLNELEMTYHLGYGFKPAQHLNMLNKARELVANNSSINEVQISRTKMLLRKN